MGTPRLAVVGDWGLPERGLSIRILADSTRFDLGEEIQVGIGFQFDPVASSSLPSIIDFAGDFGHDIGFTLRFVSSTESSHETFERDPYFPGGIPTGTLRCVALADVHRHAGMKVFHLLSREAAQVPPGRYWMTAHYENDGGPLIVGSTRDGSRFYPECVLGTSRIDLDRYGRFHADRDRGRRSSSECAHDPVAHQNRAVLFESGNARVRPP